MSWVAENPAEVGELSFSVRLLTQRTFIDCDPLLQTHYVLENPVALSGDFDIEVEFATTSQSEQSILGSRTEVTEVRLVPSNGNVEVTLNSDVNTFALAVTGKIDGKKHSLKVGLRGTSLELFIDEESKGLAFTTSTPTFERVGLGYQLGIRNFDGIISNPKITDLTNPSNSESWKLDQPYPINTEQSSSGNNLLTYVNAAESTRDNYTLTDEVWVGSERVANGGFDSSLDGWNIGSGGGWSWAGGEAIGVSLDSATKNLNQLDIFSIGDVFNVTFSGSVDVGSLGIQNDTGTPIGGATPITTANSEVSLTWVADREQLLVKRFTDVNNATLDNVSVKRIIEVA